MAQDLVKNGTVFAIATPVIETINAYYADTNGPFAS